MSGTLRRNIRLDRAAGSEPIAVAGGPWQQQAACNGLDADAWFAEGAYRNYADARETCMTLCPVRAECLQMALNDTLLTFGMYGGLDPDERRALRRRARGPHALAIKPENVDKNRRRYAMHKAGATDPEMAAAENVSPDAIKRWRHEHRLPINPASKSEAAKKWRAEKKAGGAA